MVALSCSPEGGLALWRAVDRRFGVSVVWGGALCGVLRPSSGGPRAMGQVISAGWALRTGPRSLPLRRYESPLRLRISAW
jgi:hypothetical protein